MATAKSVSNLAVVVTADTAGATRGFHALQKSVDQLKAGIAGGVSGGLLSGKAAGIGGLLGGLIGGPGGAGVGVAVGGTIDTALGSITSAISTGVSGLSQAVQQMVQVGAEYEMSLAVFSTAIGSDEGGKKVLKGIQGLATGTIFSSRALAQQAQILLGYGVAAENLVPTLTKLALISQKTGRGEEGLGRLSLAFAQSKSAGRLFGTELNQFKEAGIGPDQFAKTMGVSSARLRELMEEGQVGFNVVAETINRMGTEAETVADKMNRVLIGRFNSVKDIGLQVFGEIGLGIINAFKLPDVLGGVAGLLSTLPEKAKEFIPYLERAQKLIEPIATGLYAGFSASAEAGKQFVTSFLPSMKDSEVSAKSLGENLAVGMGTAVDYAIDFGIELTRGLSASIKMMDMLMADIKPTIDSLKFISKISMGAQNWLPGLLGGGKSETTAGKALDELNAGLLAAKAKGGEGGFAARARETFLKGLPSIPGIAPKFDQSGTAVGIPALSKSITDLAKTINENGMTGKGQSPFVDFQTNFSNLMKAEQGGLIQSRESADSFLFSQFKQLTGSMNRIENTLPAAIDRFTVEGQSRIEKVIANMQGTGQDDVPAQLRMANELHRKQLEEQKRVVEQLRRLAPQIPFQVG